MRPSIKQELERLRESLPREHAIEAFEHLNERAPLSDLELEKFITEYVREAYSDGVTSWDDLGKATPVHRSSMQAPLGRKLKKAGYSSLWDYLHKHGFTDVERVGHDLDFNTLAPAGFMSFVVEVAAEDGNWGDAFRALLTYRLNQAGAELAKSKSKDLSFILFPILYVPRDFPPDIKWVTPACEAIATRLKNNPDALKKTWSWDDPLILEVMDEHSRM